MTRIIDPLSLSAALLLLPYVGFSRSAPSFVLALSPPLVLSILI